MTSLRSILTKAITIAALGASTDSEKASNRILSYLSKSALS